MAHDLRAEVGRIPHRTLVIGARDDQITPMGFFEELAKRIPGATLTLLDEGGHFCPMTVPETYNEALLAFLAD
jgi:aminoacrylate hydrolase